LVLIEVCILVDFSENYFSIFALPISCEIDLELLAKKYRKLLMEYHPDRQLDATKKLESVTTTSLINKAYNTLKNLDSRACYLLKISGLATNVEQVSIDDHDFLEEQLNLRETIEKIKQKATLANELPKIKAKIYTDIKKYYVAFSNHFNTSTKDSIKKATQAAYKLKFICKLQDTLEQML
jgi:molecular chaperone HscB